MTRILTITFHSILCFLSLLLVVIAQPSLAQQAQPRERISINEAWKFMRYESEPDKLIYDERPVVSRHKDDVVADTRPEELNVASSSDKVLKRWILPSANDFIRNPAERHQRPAGHPGADFPFVQKNFDDSAWEHVRLPHDWAIKADFYKEAHAIVGGGMGRLPVHGVAWYRRTLDITAADKGKTIYLDIDGAMSYAMVWLNGKLVGGWPFGYNSFRLDLSEYLNYNGSNQLAIRLDNPAHSSRWYPGGGIYRNVWLTKVQPVHVGQWGTFVRTSQVSAASAKVDLDIYVENRSAELQQVRAETEVYILDNARQARGKRVASFPSLSTPVKAGVKTRLQTSVNLKNPLLWEPMPSKTTNRYVAVTRLYVNNRQTDEYETRFGIRSIEFDPVRGLLVNGKAMRIQGVNQHHDLGALGAAFNVRAAERQLEMLKEMGCNAIRMAHNPPAPELLELTDRMGFVVVNEIYDSWERGKTPLDFHLIFKDWQEADLRAFIRRDRNHPSIIAWSYGNEVGEQYTEEAGAALSKRLHDIVKEEDNTRPTTASMNYAKAHMPFPGVMDLLSLNYQGEGIRDAPAYSHLKGIRTSPSYPDFHNRFPDKVIIGSETASTLSSRGTFIFPVIDDYSAPVSDTTGGDPRRKVVSAYDLYTSQFGASPDKVFSTQDQHPYVAGEFVWSGWDYLGEPTPYYEARSSYSGIIDLAGFKKDRFYLYQARWRPDLPMAHILPHWSWPGREGLVTPVHVYSSGDEAELFLNGRSMGRIKRGQYEYRFRWDKVIYEPGVLKVISYKNGKEWATDVVRTAGAPTALKLIADKKEIEADGKDLAFITLEVLDSKGNMVPGAENLITFEVNGPGEIVATDNGDAANLVSFSSKERAAFSGKALAIVRSNDGRRGSFRVTAKTAGLKPAELQISLK